MVTFCMALALSLVSFSGCLYANSVVENAINKSDEAFELVDFPTWSWTYNEEYKTYDIVIDGILKNVTNKAWKGVSIILTIYDKDGNGIGSAYDYIEYVAANGTWRFCATATTKYEPAGVTLREVYADTLNNL